MKIIHHTRLLVPVVVSVLAGCAGDRQPRMSAPSAADSLYTAEAAMKVYGTEPERALLLIDSALFAGHEPIHGHQPQQCAGRDDERLPQEER